MTRRFRDWIWHDIIGAQGNSWSPISGSILKVVSQDQIYWPAPFAYTAYWWQASPALRTIIEYLYIIAYTVYIVLLTLYKYYSIYLL